MNNNEKTNKILLKMLIAKILSDGSSVIEIINLFLQLGDNELSQEVYNKYNLSKKDFIIQRLGYLESIKKEEIIYDLANLLLDGNSIALREDDYFKQPSENDINKLKDLLNNCNSTSDSIITFTKGSYFDAFKILQKILNSAENSIMLFDNYLSASVFDTFLNKINNNVKIILFSRGYERDFKIYCKKFNDQYRNLKLITSNDFHQRMIKSDNDIFLISESLKDIGNNNLFIIKIEDDAIKNFINSCIDSCVKNGKTLDLQKDLSIK